MSTVTSRPGAATKAQRPDPPSGFGRRAGLAVVLVVAVLAWFAAGLELDKLLRAPARIADLFGLLFFPPQWDSFGIAMRGMLESVQMAWLGTLMAAVLSLPLSLLAARNVSGRFGSEAVRQVLNAIRAFPELVLVILIVTVFGLGPVTGTIALGIHSIGTLGKLSSEAVESIDRGPLEAVDAVGGTWSQRMRWGVLPQAMPEIVAFWLYRFEINIRASAVLGVVGAGGIGAQLTETLRYKEFGRAGMAFIVVVGVTLVIDAISGRIRRRIIAGATDDPTGDVEGDTIMHVEAGAVSRGEV
jgi:phosphonate transport system permease protein